MNLVCPLCHNDLEFEGELQDGQHVLCPFCNGKFSYDSSKSSKRFEEEHYFEKNSVKSALTNSVLARFKWWLGSIIVIIGLIIFLFALVGRESTMQMKTKSVNPNSCPISSTLFAANLLSPEVGKGYIHLPDKASIRVEQVLENEGVIVSGGENKVFIETEREYVDGSKLSFGLYVCTGTAKFTAANGTPKTMWVFKEADKTLASERYEQKLKEAAAEEIKRQKIEAQQELEQKQMELKAAEEAAKAQLEIETQKRAQQEELERLKAEQKRREDEMRMQQEVKEKEEREKRLFEEAEEAKKRYPIEQEQRKNYLRAKLTEYAFELPANITIQQDLKKYIYSAKVTEVKWAALKKMQAEENWLGMLSEITGEEKKDYPSVEVMDIALRQLDEMMFHVEFLFTHKLSVLLGSMDKDESGTDAKSENRVRRIGNIIFSQSGSIGSIELSERCFERNNDEASCIVSFSFGSPRRLFLYSRDDYRSELERMEEKCKGLLGGVEEDVKLGKVSNQEGENRKEKIIDDYKRAVKNWLKTAKVKLSDYSTRVRGKGSTVNSKADGSLKNSFSEDGVDDAAFGETPQKRRTIKKRQINPELKRFKGPGDR